MGLLGRLTGGHGGGGRQRRGAPTQQSQSQGGGLASSLIKKATESFKHTGKNGVKTSKSSSASLTD